MKASIRCVFGLLLLLAFDWAVAGPADALRIVTTTPDLAAIARAVGGGHVKVDAIAGGAQDPHYVEAKPSYIRRVNRADLLIYNGLELEVGWLPLLIEGARNPKITPGSIGHLNASAGVAVLEVPEGEVDRSQGDVHPEGNPHYLLNPRNGLVVARNIASRLGQLDPEHQADYAHNLGLLEADLTGQMEQWQERVRSLEGIPAVAYHKTWEYLADWLGIKIVNYVEEKPGIPAPPRHLAQLVNQMKAEEIGFILAANYNPIKQAKSVAKRTGAQLLVLPAAVRGEKGIQSYAQLLEHLVTQLERVGKERG